jgi:hypothetical protein
LTSFNHISRALDICGHFAVMDIWVKVIHRC